MSAYKGDEKFNQDDLKNYKPKDENEPLDEKELEIAAQIKEGIGPERAAMLQEDILICFVRGYAYEGANWANKCIEVLTATLDWRKEVGADTILDNVPEGREEMRKLWPTGCFGEDEYGHPVYYEQLGLVDPPKLLKRFSQDQLLQHHVYNQEYVRHQKIKASERKGHRVYKQVVVLDLRGFGSKHLSTAFYKPIKQTVDIDQWFYPEILIKLVIINAPWLFQGMWKIIKPWLHPITAAKISVVGKDWIPEMEKYGIPQDNIPSNLGGTGGEMAFL